MELRVEKLTLPEVINFNFEELRDEITERASSYKNLVYSEDQMKQAKTDCAMLRKFTKALSDERIRVKKEILKPYDEFEAKINELSGIVNEAIGNIDTQVKAADEKRKAEKKQEIIDFWNMTAKEEWDAGRLPEEIGLPNIWDEKWLNSSASMKSIQEAITYRIECIEADIATLRDLPEYAFEAVECYKYTLNITTALNEAHRLSEMAKRKAEQERIEAERAAAAQEQPKVEPIPNTPCEFPADAMNEPEQQEIPTWVSFKALLTVENAKELQRFFKARGILFEAL